MSDDNTKVPEEASGNRIANFMRRHPKLVIVLVVVCFGYLWIKFIQYPDYTVRYRLTIEVQTPDGVKTGSSVMASNYGWTFTGFGLTSGVKNRFAGEAVFVDLGNGKNLIVTLTNKGSGRTGNPWKGGPMGVLHLPRIVFEIPYDKWGTPVAIWRALDKGAREIAPSRLPTTVTFTDINDPKTVKRVDPRNLADTFGDGYALKRAMVEVTRVRVSKGIAGKLKWLDWNRERFLEHGNGRNPIWFYQDVIKHVLGRTAFRQLGN